MHNEMTRVLFALVKHSYYNNKIKFQAIGPLVNHFLPAFHTSFSMMACRKFNALTNYIFNLDNAAFSSMVSSCFLVLTPFLNPIFTLVFIRPYRRIIMGWLMKLIGLKHHPISTSVHSANNANNTSKHDTIAMIA
jgi:hypothetical protein